MYDTTQIRKEIINLGFSFEKSNAVERIFYGSIFIGFIDEDNINIECDLSNLFKFNKISGDGIFHSYYKVFDLSIVLVLKKLKTIKENILTIFNFMGLKFIDDKLNDSIDKEYNKTTKTNSEIREYSIFYKPILINDIYFVFDFLPQLKQGDS